MAAKRRYDTARPDGTNCLQHGAGRRKTQIWSLSAPQFRSVFLSNAQRCVSFRFAKSVKVVRRPSHSTGSEAATADVEAATPFPVSEGRRSEGSRKTVADSFYWRMSPAGEYIGAVRRARRQK